MGFRGQSRAVAIGAPLLVVLTFAARATAHADLDPLHDHRVVSLHVTPTTTTLGYTLAFSAASSAELVKQLDQNGDGRLTGAELTALRLQVRRLAGLAVDLDGEKIAATDGEIELSGADAEPSALREIAVRFTTHPLGRPPAPPSAEKRKPAAVVHTLRLADGTKLPRPGDFHVRLSAEGGARIASVDRKVEMRLSFLEAAFHRDEACQASACAVEVSFEGGGARGSEAGGRSLWSRSSLLPAACFVGVAGALGGLWLVRSRRRAERSKGA
jgi:hypothetical protein